MVILTHPGRHLVYLHVGHHVQINVSHFFLSAFISATMSASLCISMLATMSSTMSASTMSSWRFFRSQRRWQNGNPKVWRTRDGCMESKSGNSWNETFWRRGVVPPLWTDSVKGFLKPSLSNFQLHQTDGLQKSFDNWIIAQEKCKPNIIYHCIYHIVYIISL